MLADALMEGSRQQVADGVFLYQFSQESQKQEKADNADTRFGIQQKFELFFCCKGSFAIKRENAPDEQIYSEDIVLLSDALAPFTIAVQKPVVGYGVVAYAQDHSALNRIYQILNTCPEWEQMIREFLKDYRGCFHVKHTFWKQGVFSVLQSLPEWQQPYYCILKAAELFYLLNTQQITAQHDIGKTSVTQGYTDTFHCMRMYIEQHLDEKLSIAMLCQRFNLSATTLKNKFHELYGQPVHRWISACRLQRAAELLQFTNLKIVQVAQAVGYESASQFNVAFRKTYGIAPTRYRKNVRYSKKQADSNGKANNI